MAAYCRQLPELRITIWAYGPGSFDIKIRERQVKSFRSGRPVSRG